MKATKEIVVCDMDKCGDEVYGEKCEGCGKDTCFGHTWKIAKAREFGMIAAGSTSMLVGDLATRQPTLQPVRLCEHCVNILIKRKAE